MSETIKPTPQEIQDLREAADRVKNRPKLMKRDAQAEHLRDLRNLRDHLDRCGVTHGGKRISKSQRAILTRDNNHVPTLEELQISPRKSQEAGQARAIQQEQFDAYLADEKANLSVKGFLRHFYPVDAPPAANGDAAAATEVPNQADDISDGCEFLRRAFGGGLPEAAEQTLKLSPQKQKLINRVVREMHEFGQALKAARNAPKPVAQPEHKAADTGIQAGVQ